MKNLTKECGRRKAGKPGSAFANPTAYAYVKQLIEIRNLRPSEEKVLEVIASFIVRGRHSAVIGQAAISAHTGFCLRTVKSAVASLKALGLLRCVSRYGSDSRRTHSSLEIVGLKDVISNRKETRLNSSPRCSPRCSPRGKKCPTSYIKGLPANSPSKTAQGERDFADQDGIELVDPWTGEVLPVVGGTN